LSCLEVGASKEKSQSLRLHLLRYTFTVAEVIRRSSPEPNQQPNPISLKMATQQQTQQATAESPYDEENDQQIVAQKSAVAAVQQPQYGAESRQYMLPPRAEGYRPAAIRESRIKDRPYKPVGDSSLSIKIELDLEVEVSSLCVLGN